MRVRKGVCVCQYFFHILLFNIQAHMFKELNVTELETTPQHAKYEFKEILSFYIFNK